MASSTSSAGASDVIMEDIVVKVELTSPPASPQSTECFEIVPDTFPSQPISTAPSNIQLLVNPSPEYILSDPGASGSSALLEVKVEKKVKKDPPPRPSRLRRVSPGCFKKMELILSHIPKEAKPPEPIKEEVDPNRLNYAIVENSSNRVLGKPWKPFKCLKCNKSFSVERMVRNHHCDPDLFECDVCAEKFSSAKSLEEHQTTVKCGICKDCGKEFTDSSAFKAHKLLSHAEGASFKCSLCKISFNRVFSLTNHIRKAHSKKSFECDICGKVLPDEKSLDNHQQENTCARCAECGRIFDDLSTFRAHRMTAHIAGGPYICHICKTAFHTMIKLTHHFRKCHDPNIYDCSTCGKKLPDAESLRIHESDHSCVKCHDCGKEYLNVDALKAHRYLAHIEGPNRKCTICNTTFAKPTGLIRHMRARHNEMTPYSCKFCGHRCAKPSEFRQHMKTHKRRPFACTECDMRFTTKPGLITHQRRVHVDDKPHVCPHCNKSFSMARFLESHMKVVHNPEKELRWQARLESIQTETPSEELSNMESSDTELSNAELSNTELSTTE